MRRLLFAVTTIVAFTLPLQAGSITITVVGDAGVGTRTRTFTVPDAHINRLVAWARIQFATPPTTPTVEVPNPPLPPPLTVPQALGAWAASLMDGTRGNVRRFELDTAKEAVPQPSAFDAN